MEDAAPPPLPTVLDSLDRYGARSLFEFEGETHTYRDARDAIFRIAEALRAAGLAPGQGFALLADNRPELFYVRTAATLVGIRFVALHPLGSPRDHAYVVGDAGLDAVVFDPSFEPAATSLAQEAQLSVLASLGPSDHGFDLLAESNMSPGRPAVADAAPVRIAYTGGTTGKPKGIVMIPSALSFAWATMAEHWQWPLDLRLLLSTPLSHAAGSLILPTIAKGGTIILLRKFSVSAWLAAVETHGATAALVVPTQLYKILDAPNLAATDLASLETVIYGAAPCSPTRLADAISTLGPIFFQFYGQTEAPMTMCMMRKEEHDPTIAGRLGSCGRPLPGVDLRLLDDEGQEVPRGQAGEICVRGPLVALREYKGRPEETAATLRNGWLHTGDVARIDEDGFVHIVDRKKDMIISGGFNLYPKEIEDCLGAHPGVSDVAVIGVPHETWGESVHAVVVRNVEHEVTAGDLIDHVRASLGSMYAPKSVSWASEIPLSPLGKHDKKALRAPFWVDRTRGVS
ncbi:MAG: AMP-binding protein [Ilumatobacteraceae bacterium]